MVCLYLPNTFLSFAPSLPLRRHVFSATAALAAHEKAEKEKAQAEAAALKSMASSCVLFTTGSKRLSSPLPSFTTISEAVKAAEAEAAEAKSTVQEEAEEVEEEVEGVVAMACGLAHSAVLTSSGRLCMWGSALQGQMGSQEHPKFLVPHDVTEEALQGAQAAENIVAAFAARPKTAATAGTMESAETFDSQDAPPPPKLLLLVAGPLHSTVLKGAALPDSAPSRLQVLPPCALCCLARLVSSACFGRVLIHDRQFTFTSLPS